MKKIFLLLLLINLSSSLFSQNLTGIWEGKLQLNTGKNRQMNLRFEIIELDNLYFGVIYSRGIEKNNIYGCDYILSGTKMGGIIQFKPQKNQRAVGMQQEECSLLNEIVLYINQKDSLHSVNGNWVWQNNESSGVILQKVADEISEMGTDEINSYVEEVYTAYENLQVLLPAEQRLNKKVLTQQIDSSTLIVEFSTLDSSKHDSVSVFMNGNPIAENYSLWQKKLRFRFEALQPGENDLLIVNQSAVKSKLHLQVKIFQQGVLKLSELFPSFTANSFIHFTSKSE